ncbi:ABC transporter substrate-binding protein [Cupriavidus sp. UYMSc13B]|nr:ABC transporter substrate-binding protein [Cupriavidus sp. UYMSc13B]
MAPLVSEIGRRFSAIHPGVCIEVQTGGSGRGVSDAREGKADIGMVSRTLAESSGALYGFPIARDGVAVIVHRDNPVQALSDRQLTDIFTGKVTNWKRVGGRDVPIQVLAGEANRASSELLVHYLGIRYEDIHPQRLVGDNALRIKAIAETPGAVVYVSVGEAERKAKAGVPIKLLPVAGIEATSQNVRQGSFPISRPLTLVTRGLPKGLAKTFVEFSLSSQVTDLVVTYDFIPYLD